VLHRPVETTSDDGQDKQTAGIDHFWPRHSFPRTQETLPSNLYSVNRGGNLENAANDVEYCPFPVHISAMRRQIALAVLVELLASCAPGVVPYGDSSLEREPNYEAIITQNLRSPRTEPGVDQKIANINSTFFGERGNIFSNPKKIGFVEIADSGRRVINNTIGWTWMTCIRAQIGDTRGTYAIFISGNAVVDARLSIVADRCDGLNYRPLDFRTPGTDEPHR